MIPDFCTHNKLSGIKSGKIYGFIVFWTRHILVSIGDI